MEIVNIKNIKSETKFNVDISRQWIPYWNGLLHLIGDVEEGVVIRRYDWDKMVEECNDFQTKYLNTGDFCNQCLFATIPEYLRQRMAQKPPDMSCKAFAQDNDILYIYCRDQLESTRSLEIWAIVLICTAIILVLGMMCYYFLFR